jgi:hypothetical protein
MHAQPIPGFPDYTCDGQNVYSNKQGKNNHKLALIYGYQRDKIYQLWADGKSHYRSLDEINRLMCGETSGRFIIARTEGIKVYISDEPHVYLSETEANNSAQGRAKSAPGCEFVVLQAKSTFKEIAKVKVRDLTHSQAIHACAGAFGNSCSVEQLAEIYEMTIMKRDGFWSVHTKSKAITSENRSHAIYLCALLCDIGEYINAHNI